VVDVHRIQQVVEVENDQCLDRGSALSAGARRMMIASLPSVRDASDGETDASCCWREFVIAEAECTHLELRLRWWFQSDVLYGTESELVCFPFELVRFPFELMCL
jgi:hypothetical protein